MWIKVFKVLGETLLALTILTIFGVMLDLGLFSGILPFAFVAGLAGSLADRFTANKPRLFVAGMMVVVYLGGYTAFGLTTLILTRTHLLTRPWLYIPALVLGVVSAIVSFFAYYFVRKRRLAIEAFELIVR